MLKQKIKYKNKKAISNLVAYVILISIVVVIGSVVYSVMKTYVPKDSLECPSGVSILIKDYYCSSTELSLVLKNNGNFNIGGYIIHVTNNPEAELATIDLSSKIISGGIPLQGRDANGIKFGTGENSLFPNYEENNTFDISSISPIYSIEITPMRWQEEGRKKRVVNCVNAKMRKRITCT